MRLKDADELLEKTEYLFKDLNSTEDFMGIGYNHGVGDSIAIIKNAPTIEAEPVKHGRWKWHNEDGWYYSCSVCGHNAYGNTDNIVSGLWAYCPNCGAKMDAEEGAEP